MAQNIKLAYPGSSSLTITLASLASDTSLLAGRSSAVIDNTTNLYEDIAVSGHIKAGTSPTAGNSIYLYAVGIEDDTPTWPDTFNSAPGDAAVTLTSSNIRDAVLAFVWSVPVTATSNVVYPVRKTSLASCFGGYLPKKMMLWVVHNTAVNLNASGHSLVIDPVYRTVG